MKRSTAIAISVVSILAAASFTVFAYSVKSLDLAGNGIGQIEATGMDVSFDACNPSFLPVTVEGAEINLHGISDSYGMITLEGKTIPPMSEQELQGTADFADYGTMSKFVDWTLNNQSSADFNATVLVKTKILGIMPYSYEKNYDLVGFSNLLLGNNPSECKQKQNHVNDIKQQLLLIQERTSTTSLLYSGKIDLSNGTQYAGTNSTGDNSLP